MWISPSGADAFLPSGIEAELRRLLGAHRLGVHDELAEAREHLGALDGVGVETDQGAEAQQDEVAPFASRQREGRRRDGGPAFEFTDGHAAAQQGRAYAGCASRSS